MLSYAGYVAVTRFGMGALPGEAARASSDPRQWLRQQIIRPQERGAWYAALPSTAQNMQHMLAVRQEKKEATADQKIQMQNEQLEYVKTLLVNEMRAKVQHAMTTPTPFYERLVDFWGNHFAVSIKKSPFVHGIVGAYEREAIRPYVTGKFVDMLLAVVQHPAMLLYLDNAQSIGPDSIAGQKNAKGLNENLAREIMELHTLGVNGGYTQTDVTTFAKVITGWGYAPAQSPTPGTFQFIERRHEPGTQYILGKAYPDTGVEQGIAVLRDLANSPQTAHHIATKLARHFVSDTPPEDAIKRLARVFMGTGGDLPAMYATLINMSETWDARTNAKVKSGYDLVISAARASGGRGDDETVKYCMNAMRFLGDFPYTADSPAGTPDTARDIAGPEAMIRRVEWAQAAAVRLAPDRTALALADDTIGPIMSSSTRDAIVSARQEREAVAVLFGSPEFQRR